MPVPGPRTQFGPDPGFRNPDDEAPHFFNQWFRPGPVLELGQSPGTMVISLRGMVQAPGQVRKLWQQAINLIPAQGAYSWTTMSNSTANTEGKFITRAIRYMTRSIYMGQGIDNTRYEELHTVIQKQNFHKPITVAGGSVPGRPTIRNRMTSFGSRVPTLNSPVSASSNNG